MNVSLSPAASPRTARRYVRPPNPLHFPESLEMPETGVHVLLRAELFLLVRALVGARAAVGSDQFLYWDPSDPRKCLAPDLIVRIGAPPEPFPTWKVWERGAPHLAVEIVSPSDAPAARWAEKLERYRRAGIDEVVRFEPDAAERPLRLWDRFEGDLVERDLEGENALLCDALGLYWCMKPDPALGRILRLSRDPFGMDLVPTPVEQERQAKEQERQAKEQERQAKEQERAAKEAALLRIAELEAELRRLASS